MSTIEQEAIPPPLPPEEPQGNTLAQLTKELPGHTFVLGRQAVIHGLQEATAAVEGRPNLIVGGKRDRQLDVIRKDLDDAMPWERRAIGKRMSKNGLPTWLMHAAGVGRPKDLADRLIETTDDGTPAVGNDTLQNILEWHNAQYVRSAERTEQEVVAPMRERMIARLQAQVEKGSLPKALLPQTTLEAIRRIPVHEDDGAGPDGHFRGGGVQPQGYARISEQEVVLKSVKDNAFTEKLLYHELIHAISGRTWRRDSEWRHAGYGLGRLMHEQSGWASRGLDLLNEAVTEHFAQVLFRGGDINDIKLFKMHSSYNQGLMLLKALCTKGEVPISPQLFVNAMLSGDKLEADGVDNPESLQAFEVLQQALEAAFPGKDVIEQIAAFDSFAFNGSISMKEVRKFIRNLK